MPSEHDTTNLTQINTSGGAIVKGNVNIDGGDFVGHDKIVITEETAYHVYGLTNPYLGLRAFHYEDSAIYAGREQLSQETVQCLTKPGAQQTLLFITGASGSGKSSFAQAGLIPLLESHYATYQKTVRHAIMRPSGQPMVMLADALQKLHPTLTPSTLGTNRPIAQINLLLIDQFEELFIQSDASQRTPFCDFLTNLPNFAEGRTHVLITLRVDYLDELFAIQPLWAIAKAGVELRTMSADDLRHAIQKPLQVYHPQKRFAPELLERLVQDGGADAALLPLLQVTLAELWKTGKLVLSNYQSLTDAIRQRAEMVYAFSDYDKADPKTPRPALDQQGLMGILLDLINVSVDGTDHRDARQRRTRQELEQASPQRPRLIEELVNSRLLAAASETRNGADIEVIDIIHESMIDNWDRLRNAIDEQRQQLQRRARFKLWLSLWLQNGRNDGHLLLTEMQLAEARTLVEQDDIELRGLDAHKFYQRSIEYQQASREVKARADAEAKARQQWVQRLGIALALVAIAAGVAIWQYFLAQDAADREIVQRQRAEIAATGEGKARVTSDANANIRATAEMDARQQAGLAQAAEATAKAAQATVEALNRFIRTDQLANKALPASEPPAQLALLLGVEAANVYLRQNQPVLPIAYTTLHRLLHQTGGIPLIGHQDYIRDLDISPDDQWLVTASSDRTAWLWSITQPTTASISLGIHEDQVWAADFSSNGRWLATADLKTVRLWQRPFNAPPTLLTGLGENEIGITNVAFSPDNKWLAAAIYSYEGVIRLWEVAHPQRDSIALTEHSGDVDHIAFSPDGQWLASSSQDRTVRLWDMRQLLTSSLVLIDESSIGAIAFSHDSQWLAGGGTETVWLWKVGQPELKPVVLLGQEDYVRSLAFSPDDQWLASGSEDKIVRLWNVAQPQTEPIVLSNSGYQVAFSSDGQRLATTDKDQDVRLWSLTSITRTRPIVTTLQGHEAGILGVAFAHKGQWFATTDQQGGVRLWNTDQPFAEPMPLSAEEITLSSADSALDLRWFTYGNRSTLRLWTALHPQSVRIFPPLNSNNPRALSTDGKWLAGSDNGTIRLWNLTTPQIEPIVVQENSPFINDLAFSPDNRWVVSARHSFVHLHNLTSPQSEPIALSGQSANVRALAFSPDGKWLASGGDDYRVRLWNIAELEPEPTSLTGNVGVVTSVAFSPDGKWLASADYNMTVQLWDLNHLERQPVNFPNAGDSVVFSTNSQWLAGGGPGQSGNTSTAIRLWNVTQPQAEPIILPDTGAPLAFSRDNRWLVTNNQQVWLLRIEDLTALACRTAGRNLSQIEWSQYFPGESYRKTCPQFPVGAGVVGMIAEPTPQPTLTSMPILSDSPVSPLSLPLRSPLATPAP